MRIRSEVSIKVTVIISVPRYTPPNQVKEIAKRKAKRLVGEDMFKCDQVLQEVDDV